MRIKPGLTPLRVLLFFGVIVALLIIFRPQVAQRPAAIQHLAVEAQPLQPRDFRISIHSFGQVQPRVRSKLMAEVGGRIITVSDNFRPGGFFAEGEILLWLDNRDYQLNVTRAEAEYAEALSQLAQEQALVEQALADWRRLNKPIELASDLVLRKPQLASAEARVKSAQANLAKARLDLDRTKVVAPYRGRILTQAVDLGGAVKANDRLAEIYASDYLEVRLPLRNSDLPFAQLPEDFGSASGGSGPRPKVLLHSDLLGEQSWQGRIVRTESAVDEKNRQLYVVARIDDPYGKGRQHEQPLKIGQFVTAVIQGRLIHGAMVIPNSTIYHGSYVFVVEEGAVYRRPIEILWQDDSQAMIGAGLKAGELLVTTGLGNTISGTPVRLVGESAAGGSETNLSQSPGPVGGAASGSHVR